VKRRKIRKYVPPAFFAMLGVSLAMWWLTQLSSTYNGVEIPVVVKAEGNIFEVGCYASGSGYKLAAHRLLHKSEVEVTFEELGVVPSPVRPGWGIVNPETLTAAIARRMTDVKVERVGAVPEILLRGR
jgi:hypothetical protein